MSKFDKMLFTLSKLEEGMQNIGIPPLREDLIRCGFEKGSIKKAEIAGLVKVETKSLVRMDNKTGEKVPMGGKCLVCLTDAGKEIVQVLKIEEERIKKQHAEEEKAQGAKEVMTIDDLLKPVDLPETKPLTPEIFDKQVEQIS